MIKNLSIFNSKSFFLGLTSLWEVKQSILHSISFFLTIIGLEVVLRELWGLADLTRAQTLWNYKLVEVIIISKDKNFIFAAF